jgi:hypothetical protein
MEYDIQLGYKSFNLESVRAALIADKPVCDELVESSGIRAGRFN